MLFTSSRTRRSRPTGLTPSVLAKHYASGFLPEVCTPDEPTQALRQQVTRRKQIVQKRSRLKNIIRSILHSDLMSRNAPIRHISFCLEARQFPGIVSVN